MYIMWHPFTSINSILGTNKQTFHFEKCLFQTLYFFSSVTKDYTYDLNSSLISRQRKQETWSNDNERYNNFRKKFKQTECSQTKVGSLKTLETKSDFTAAGMDLFVVSRNSVAIVAKTYCRLNEDTKGRNGNNLRSSDPEWVLCPLLALPHSAPNSWASPPFGQPPLQTNSRVHVPFSELHENIYLV